ncbi:MAG: leucine-rich repeat domain-containing protein [Lachnospiraceae bacterium]|nr:leucine-rich repeat domain-containing protein [Lachnospiraceae bacterium]
MTQTRKKLVFSWVLILAMVISVISPGSALAVKAADADYQTKLTAVTKCLHDNVEPVYGNEWALIQQARGEGVNSEIKQKYDESLKLQLANEDKVAEMQSNAWARVILTLDALGFSPENYNGVNLYEKLSDFSSLDFGIYAVPTMAYILMGTGLRNDSVFNNTAIESDKQTTKQKLIDSIVKYYDKDHKCWGGPDYNTKVWTPDPDTSSQAIQGLSYYYNYDEEIKSIIDNTLTTISKNCVDENGRVMSYGNPNASSTAQVICALVSVGIDPTKDTRFIKNGNNLIDGLCSFIDDKTGGVISSWTGELDLQFDTVQAGYALVAYDRYLKNQRFIFDIYSCKDGHDWGDEISVTYWAANCLRDETKAVRCKVCGEIKPGTETKGKDALGHSGGVATCVNKAECIACGLEYGNINSNNHIGKTSLKNTKEATCTEKGYTGDKVCDDCKEVIEKGKEIAAKGHTPVEIPAVAPTEETAGKTAGKKCSVCGEILEAQKDVPATGKTEPIGRPAPLANIGCSVLDYEAGTAEFDKPIVYETKVLIPDVVQDDYNNGKEYKVVKIAENAFYYNKVVTEVSIGKNITEIGKKAFVDCAKLKTVSFRGTNIAVIGESAFSGDKALTSIDLSKNKLQTIDKNAFSGCKKLKDIKLNGNKLTKVGKNAFKNVKKNAKFTIYAKNKKTYKKVVKLIKKSGAKKVKFTYKKKK